MAEIRHPNLSTKEGTFVQVFEENKIEFTKLSDDPDVTYSELKDYILELLDGCKQTPWINHAKVMIERNLRTKHDLVFYFYNAYLSGENLKVIR